MLTDRTEAMNEIRSQLEAGEAEAALDRLGEIADDSIADPNAELLQARAEIAVGDPDAALQSLTRAGTFGAPVEEVRALYDAVRAEGGMLAADVHAKFLDWLIDEVRDADLAMTLARIHMSRNRRDRAGAAARRALAIDPTRALAYRYAYVAALRADQIDEAVSYIQAALEHAAEDPRFPSLRSTMMGLDPVLAGELMSELTRRWPDSLSAGSKTGDLNADDAGPGLLARRAYLAAIAGDTDTAMALAAEARSESEIRRQSMAIRDREIERVIEALPGPETRSRPLVEDNGAEVIVSGPSQTGVTLLCLTNLTHRMSFDHEVIDAVAAAAGAASVILRDFTFRLFIGGVGQLGPDRASTMAALRKILADLGTERLIVVGTSAGAYSAVSYGRGLGAAETHGLGTPTSIGRFLSGGDRRVKTLIRKLVRSFPPEALDLRQQLPRFDNENPVHLWFAEGHKVDRQHAEDLAAYPGVTLHPIEGASEHPLMQRMLIDGRLSEWLQR